MSRKPNPQEQAIYNRIVMQALKLITQPEQAQKLKSLAMQEDPAEAVATIAAVIIKQIGFAAGQAGHNLTPAFIYPAAKEVMKHMVDILVDFKIVKPGTQAQVLAKAQADFAQITGGQQAAQPQPQPQPQQGMLAQQGA